MLFKLSPENPLVLYGGGGISRYNWDISMDLVRKPGWTGEMHCEESDLGYHLCGGAEYPVSKNIFLWGEVRKNYRRN